MLDSFLQRVKSAESIDFNETIAIIDEFYCYQPTEFSNGIKDTIINTAGCNEGSCKIFAFAKLHDLTQQQTLALFGDYYRKEVLADPNGVNHLNIRTFIKDGWQGIQFKSEALKLKSC